MEAPRENNGPLFQIDDLITGNFLKNQKNYTNISRLCVRFFKIKNLIPQQYLIEGINTNPHSQLFRFFSTVEEILDGKDHDPFIFSCQKVDIIFKTLNSLLQQNDIKKNIHLYNDLKDFEISLRALRNHFQKKIEKNKISPVNPVAIYTQKKVESVSIKQQIQNILEKILEKKDDEFNNLIIELTIILENDSENYEIIKDLLLTEKYAPIKKQILKLAEYFKENPFKDDGGKDAQIILKVQHTLIKLDNKISPKTKNIPELTDDKNL